MSRVFHRTVFLVLFALLGSCARRETPDWPTNYAQALEMSKNQNKPILVDFTGSDWCSPCIEFRKRVFSRPDFRAYAEKNLILLEIDFPHKKEQPAEVKEQNEKLSKQYGIEDKGFPTVMMLDSSGKIIREMSGYDGETVASMIAWIEGKSAR